MKNLLTYKQVAELLRLSERTIRTYVANDKIPYIRFSPKTVRFEMDEIEKWINGRDNTRLPEYARRCIYSDKGGN